MAHLICFSFFRLKYVEKRNIITVGYITDFLTYFKQKIIQRQGCVLLGVPFGLRLTFETCGRNALFATK